MDERLLSYWKEESADRLDSLFETAPVLMHSIDGEGRLVRVSRFWAELLGYDREEMIGRKSVDFLTPESRAFALDTVLPEFRATGRLHNVDYTFVARDGTHIPVLLSATAELSPEGEILRSLAVLFDNRTAKAALAALERKAREAEEASQAKTRFLAAMSHEIRTPMNAILGFAQLLKLSRLDATRAEHVDAILRAGGDLMNLLTDLLDLSQVEAGKMRIERQAIDMHGLLEQVADWWYSSAQEKGLRFTISEERGLPRRVMADPLRIQQVLNNFLGNAVKFTEDGQIGLSIAHVARDGDIERLRFEVSDTGPGMSEEQQAQLFRPFVQIESDFGKERGGWGLGLSICRNIAEAMGGEVGVRSRLGEGSTFYFEVPVLVLDADSDRAREMETDRRPAPAASGALRVLVAEDNALNQQVVRKVLEGMGHSVTLAGDGFRALEEVVRGEFDVVVMDVMMPGLDGIGAARQIRLLDGPKSRIPIVACSAHVTEDAQARYRAAGMEGFVPKPIDHARLGRVIQQVVDRARTGVIPR